MVTGQVEGHSTVSLVEGLLVEHLAKGVDDCDLQDIGVDIIDSQVLAYELNAHLSIRSPGQGLGVVVVTGIGIVAGLVARIDDIDNLGCTVHKAKLALGIGFRGHSRYVERGDFYPGERGAVF